MDPLFPALPEDLSAVSDADLDALITEHLEARRMIREQNAEFLGDLNALQIVTEAKTGNEQLAALQAQKDQRVEAEQNFQAEIASLTADAPVEDEPVEEADEPVEELAAEVTEPVVEEVEEPIVAAAPLLRRPPAPSPERVGTPEPETGAVLTAAAGVENTRPGDVVTPQKLGVMVRDMARRLGKPSHSAGGSEDRYLLASASYRYPENRILTADINENAQKIRSLVNTEGNSLVASGGLCAPLTPIYTIPQFATNARPVRDGLPSFMADRGGVNVPVPTTLASAANAITVITEASDALGGTFATKSCLDQDCLDFVETAVTIISHCREYGNLNARAWPESIAFENELTMAEHARVAEGYLLDRIKAQSVKVTQASVYSETYDLIYAIARAAAAVRYRLRTGPNYRFRVLLPSWVPGSVVADVAATAFDRFISEAKVSQILRDAGVDPIYYLDTPNGTSQGWSNEVENSTLDAYPVEIQWALFPEGAFIHVDGGTLELGLVRDSTLNSTNDFQFFGESFENVALLGPEQSSLWIQSELCVGGGVAAAITNVCA